MHKPFRNLSEFAVHKERVRIEHLQRKRVIKGHMQALQDPKFRKSLTKNSATHLVEAIEPLRIAKSALTTLPGLAGTAALLFGLRGKNPIAKTVGSLATLAGPFFLARMKSSDSEVRPPSVQNELSENWSRVKRYIRRRREDREQTG